MSSRDVVMQMNLRTLLSQQKMNQMGPRQYPVVLIIDQNECAGATNGATNEH
jgi:hypothetical protein